MQANSAAQKPIAWHLRLSTIEIKNNFGQNPSLKLPRRQNEKTVL
jgi:hypothetical protein